MFCLENFSVELITKQCEQISKNIGVRIAVESITMLVPSLRRYSLNYRVAISRFVMKRNHPFQGMHPLSRPIPNLSSRLIWKLLPPWNSSWPAWQRRTLAKVMIWAIVRRNWNSFSLSCSALFPAGQRRRRRNFWTKSCTQTVTLKERCFIFATRVFQGTTLIIKNCRSEKHKWGFLSLRGSIQPEYIAANNPHKVFDLPHFWVWLAPAFVALNVKEMVRHHVVVTSWFSSFQCSWSSTLFDT